ncbi:endo-1,4-beta-xylanase [Actinospica durhamensis]|uniref:Beta-xylanase n=1 Tax=Actinospica durhamensis TaxID=1508375 RepID=A0A941EMZ7_9ACTN|nr:endo-1,4-beta-xylanase [Actinospica durhamensis]MBR7833343.1 endo-1,4-beta-xylanase [Actinospica durhamensis]
MKRRGFLALGAGALATPILAPSAAQAATGSAGAAAKANSAGSATAAAGSIPADSLRALAAKVGLRFGSALIPSDLDTPAYAQIAAQQFSVVTPGNEMKWQVVEPEQGVYDWSGADNLVAFAQANGQLVRGHTLMWHNQLPNWLTDGVANGSISATELAGLLKNHIYTEVGRYRGKIWQWDVVNEVFANSWDTPTANGLVSTDFWIQNLGEGIVYDAFRWAHEADPHALLVINDYNITGEDGTNAKFDAVHAWAQKALSQGVPVHAIGSQAHLDTQYGFPTSMADDLRAYADLGLKTAITEADVRTFVDGPTTQVPTDRLAPWAQANWWAGMLQAALSSPDCISFTVWGFCDADSWVPGTFSGEGAACLYDVNLNPKPAYTDLQSNLQLAAFGAPRRNSGN